MHSMYCRNNRFSGWKKFAGCVVPHFVNVSCSYYTRVFNNSNSLLSLANRHLCPDTSGALHVYINRPLRVHLVSRISKIINYLYWIFSLFLDHIEFDAQIPASFPSSQSQRHHQVTVLNFPYLRVQGNRVYRCYGISKRKGNDSFFMVYYLRII